MTKKQKKKLKRVVIIIIFIFLNILSLLGSGMLGEFIQNIFKYLFGLTYYWINIWLIFFTLTFFLKKRKRKKLMKYVYAILLIAISFDLLVNFTLSYKEISNNTISNQWEFNEKNINDGMGIAQSDILLFCRNVFGQIGTVVFIVILFCSGLFLILDMDEFFYSIYKKQKQLKEKLKKKNKQKQKSKISKSKINVSKKEKYKQSKDKDKNEEKKKKIEIQKNRRKKTDEKSNEKKQKEEISTSGKRTPKSIKIANSDEDSKILKQKNKIQQYKSKKEETTVKNSNEPIEKERTESLVLSNGKETKYFLPQTNLLKTIENNEETYQELQNEAESIAEKLLRALETYKLKVKIKNTIVGPAITKFELEPELGVKVNKFSNLNNDLAMAMAAKSIRIEAPIPGKSLIGIEVPNSQNMMIGLKNILDSKENNFDDKASIGLGQSITGESVFLDITKTPHLLVAGSTGSGKSVCINSIIISILLKSTPDEVKLLLIDPKKVELTPYDGIPHLLSPVITDPEEAAVALNKLILEMDKRYEIFAESKTKNIKSYNQKMKRSLTPENQLPLIITVIDELADLMMVASNEVETSIARLAQMARAAGIHLIIATQRPSTDVITGLIKSNIPTRIAFLVSSSIDSRTILDRKGAEKLLGQGDMLLSRSGSHTFERIQGAYVDDDEINDIVTQITDQFPKEEKETFFNEEFINLEEKSESEKIDPLEYKALEISLEYGKISTSLLQRKLKVGYNRAANIIEELERKKYISHQEGNKARKPLINNMDGIEE